MEIYTSGFKLKLARTNREANRLVFLLSLMKRIEY